MLYSSARTCVSARVPLERCANGIARSTPELLPARVAGLRILRVLPAYVALIKHTDLFAVICNRHSRQNHGQHRHLIGSSGVTRGGAIAVVIPHLRIFCQQFNSSPRFYALHGASGVSQLTRDSIDFSVTAAVEKKPLLRRVVTHSPDRSSSRR